MKKIRYIVLLLIILFTGISAKAASGNISVTGANNVIVGNRITINVNLSSNVAIGSWQMDLNYDKNYLQLTSSTAEEGGTSMASSTSGVKSKSYTFVFKALKGGSTTVSVGSYLAYAYEDFSQLSLTASSKTIKIQTQAEIEASYSDDAYLKELGVEGYEITPTFDKNVFEYSLEVENDVEKVEINAYKSNINATIKGADIVELTEGSNKFDIEVTSQKGNTLTYTLTIIRKELNPIKINIGDNTYSIVRKMEELPECINFSPTTISYNDEEIAALISSDSQITLIGLKDSEGKVYPYIYKNNEVTIRYIELISENIVINPIDNSDITYKGFKEELITIDGNNVKAYKYKNLNNYYLIYGVNINDNKTGYYLYDINNNTFQLFDEELFNNLNEDINVYVYILCGSLAVILISIIIIICQNNSKNKKIRLIMNEYEKLKKEKENTKNKK